MIMDQDNKTIEKPIQKNPMFSFMAIGSIIYAFYIRFYYTKTAQELRGH